MYKKILFFLSCINLQLSHASSFSFEVPGIRTLCAGISLGVAGTLAYKYYVREKQNKELMAESYKALTKEVYERLSREILDFYDIDKRKENDVFCIVIEPMENRLLLQNSREFYLEYLRIKIPENDAEYRKELATFIDENFTNKVKKTDATNEDLRKSCELMKQQFTKYLLKISYSYEAHHHSFIERGAQREPEIGFSEGEMVKTFFKSDAEFSDSGEE